MKIVEWPLSKLIKLQNPFNFTFGLIPQPLIESIKKIGILNMPIVLESKKDSIAVLVTGKRRIEVLYETDPKANTSIRLYTNSELSDLKAFHINLFENMAIRCLNPIEKSNILYILTSKLKITDQIIKKDYFPLLHLPPKESALNDFLEFQKLDEKAKKIIADEIIQTDNALRLLKFDFEDQLKLLDIIKELHLSSNNQKILIELARETSKRDRKTFLEILAQKSLQDALNNTDWTPSQKWSKFENELRHLRYPKLSRLEDDFKSIKQKMHLPPTISLQNPPYFETNNFQIQFRFKNKKEFEHILHILNSINSNSDINPLFKLTLEDE